MKQREMNKKSVVRMFSVTAICLLMMLGPVGALSDTDAGDSVDWDGVPAMPNAVTLVQSDRDVTALAFRCDDLVRGRIVEGSDVFITLDIPGLDRLGNVGEPQLPFKSVCIAVPGDQVTVDVVLDQYYDVYVGTVYPAQEPDPDCNVEAEPEFALDQSVYSADAFYPREITCTLEQGKLRGIPFAQVGFNPVQYNPVTGIARVHEAIDLEVRWDSADFAMAENLKSGYFAATYQNSFMNWAEFSTDYADELAPSQEAQRGPNGCDYLIITDPLFVVAANDLAEWKIQRGIDTRVVDTAVTGTTSAAIGAYIENAYQNWTPAPSYVLLLGDADLINTNYVNVHDYHGTLTGTDLWYYTLDGPDFLADMYYGRMPVDTASQAENYVNKIVNYETDPPYNTEYYNNITVAAYFQDTGDGYEDRRFTRTSEELRDYLMANQSYDVQRIYCTDAGTTPTHWNNGDYWWPVSGEAIPPELLRANGFPWDGDAADIKARIDSGTFLVTHRDHGAREGWGDPYFTIPEVGTLDNGDLLPIVYSINCLTGWFDHETDDAADGTSTECFCEEFLRKTDGGCVCIFGATRVSYSGYNDFMCRGWYDAAWPDFDLSIGGTDPMYRVGEIHNYGKWYMLNHYAWGDPWSLAQLTTEIFHVYGDPTMEMWTEEPLSMVVSHPSSYPFGTTQVVVNVSVDDAFVSLVQDGEIIATGYSSGGHATIPVNPLQGGVVTVTVTKHNYRPYQGSIIVPSGPHDLAVKNLEVPPTGVAGVAVIVDADIYNLGTNGETDIEVRLLVDTIMEDSMLIPSLPSGNVQPVTLDWTPTFGGSYFVQVYAVPVTGETVTWNNVMNGTTFIVAYPDIWVSPGGFDFVLEAGEEDQDILTIGNSGLANLDYSIITLQGGDSVYDDFPTTAWNPAVWDQASFSGAPLINTLGVAEPSEPNSMELDGDGDSVVSLVYETTASDSIGFDFYYEQGGGGEAPDSTDGLALEYYTSGGAWVEAWSIAGDSTLHTTFSHATVDITTADAYHSGFRYRFRSWGSGATFDDFYVDNVYFNYTVPVTDGWLKVIPDTGSVPPLTFTTVDVVVNSSTLSPGFHQSNITIINNDPDENPILVPVNVTVLSAPHDICVLSVTVQGDAEAGHLQWVNGTILNQGTNPETGIEVRLLIDLIQEDSTVIASLLSSQQETAHFTWVPPLAGTYMVSIYAFPVPSETNTANNLMNHSADFTALPDIALSQASFDFFAAPGGSDIQTLTVGNEGLAQLNYEIRLPSNTPEIMHEDFSASPTAWTITHTAGTAWTWSATNQRMENTYGYPNSGYLDSPVMDCSGRTGATLQFWHFWQANYGTSQQDGIVRGSIDGGLSWPYMVDEFHHNDPATETATKTYSVPWADGHSQVKIRFDIYNYDDWYWRIDNFYLNCTALPTCTWLTIVPDTGTVPALDHDDVVLTASAAALPVGMYFTNLTAVSNDLDEPSLIIPVTFTVSNSLPLYAIDLAGKSAPSWVFVSYPHALTGDILSILNDATLGDAGTTWSVAKWYDPQTPADPWKTYRVGGTVNDMPPMTNSMGVWLWITANGGDQALTLGSNGNYPMSAVSIDLHTGWNLVGYPSATPRLGSATLPAQADRVSVWQAASPYIMDSTPAAVTMSHGNAYWVHVTADCTWTVQP